MEWCRGSSPGAVVTDVAADTVPGREGRDPMRRESHDLAYLARMLVAPRRVVLAVDDPVTTVERRLRSVGLSSTAEDRRAYRQMLFTTPGLEERVSGVILSDEAIRQRVAKGPSFVELLTERQIVPGIRVDLGQHRLTDSSREGVSAGVEHLAGRLEEYRRLGAWFATWRAYCLVDHGIPTETCVRTNAVRLANFAALSQQAGLLPIVDVRIAPGGDHDIERGRRTMEDALATLVAELYVHHASVADLLVSASLIAPNHSSMQEIDPDAVVAVTLGCLREHVPGEVPGVILAAESLPANLVARSYEEIRRWSDLPWPLSFSLGRDAMASTLRSWARHDRDAHAAQDVLRRWATRLATCGRDLRTTPAGVRAA